MLKKAVSKLIKPFLIGSALIIVSLILWNTYLFSNEFKMEEQHKMEVWAAAQSQFLAANPNDPMGELVLKIFQSNTQTPMLLIHSDKSYTFNNYKEKPPKNETEINNIIKKFSAENPPIEINEDGTVLATLYYGEAPILKKLKYYPLGLLLILGLFTGMVYFALKLERVAAQNILWASMAKETAHQIATPLSALMAWNEVLEKEMAPLEVTQQMRKDLERLSMISQRFSSIGLAVRLNPTDLVQATQEGVAYLKERGARSITIQVITPQAPVVLPLNKPLYLWCLENLIKNSADAMKGKGSITVTLKKEKHYAVVGIIDQGHGVPKKDWNKIFKPGFSTKKTGWGLGLSLTKRIVEEYHNGILKVISSSITGTHIKIRLPL